MSYEFLTDLTFLLAIDCAGAAAKIAILIWAYRKTRQLAAIFYATFLVMSSFMGLFFLSDSFGVGWSLSVGSWLWFVEIGLFLWLIVSLVKRSRNPIVRPTDG